MIALSQRLKEHVKGQGIAHFYTYVRSIVQL